MSHPVVQVFREVERNFTENVCRPKSVQINLTNVCYSNCQSCGKKTWPQDSLKKDRVLDLIKELAHMGCESIVLSGGEPFAYGSDIISVIKTALVNNVRVGILTSGILNGKLQEEVLPFMNSLEWVKVSIDAANPDLFKEVRGVDAFNTIVENVRVWKEHNFYLKIRNNATISSLNSDQFFPLIVLGHNLGIETHFYPVHTHEGLLLTEENIDDYREVVDRILCGMYGDKIKSYVLGKTNLLQFIDLYHRKRPTTCFMPYAHLVIDANGDIFYCCRTMNDNDVYENRDMQYCAGNIYDGKLIDVLETKQAKDLRRRLSNACAPMCTFCDRYNYVNNLFLQYIETKSDRKPIFL